MITNSSNPNNKATIDTKDITRLVIVDHRPHVNENKFGRIFDSRGLSIQISIQDNHQTLKIFIT